MSDSITQAVGNVAGIFTAASMLPQVFKIIKEKEAEQVSLIMIFVLIVGICLRMAYGWLKKDIPIIATNTFSFLTNVVLIVLRIRYRK
ncbi:MAG: SemiSWEET transporter [Chitinophagales bacterium]